MQTVSEINRCNCNYCSPLDGKHQLSVLQLGKWLYQSAGWFQNNSLFRSFSQSKLYQTLNDRNGVTCRQTSLPFWLKAWLNFKAPAWLYRRKIECKLCFQLFFIPHFVLPIDMLQSPVSSLELVPYERQLFQHFGTLSKAMILQYYNCCKSW